MGFIWQGVTYTDHAENEQEVFEFHEDESSYTRQYDVAWDDRQRGVRAMLGYAKTTGGLNKYVTRFVPHSLEDWQILDTTENYLFCNRVRGKGLRAVGVGGTESKPPQFQLARLATSYQTLPYDVKTDQKMISSGYVDAHGNPDEATWARYCIINPKPAGEFFSIPTGSFFYVADGTAVQRGVGKLLVYANLAITRMGVPYDSVPSRHVNKITTPGQPDALDTMLGKVNSLQVNQYLPGTLLLSAVEIKPKRDAFGQRTYDYTTYLRYFRTKFSSIVAGVQYAAGHQFIYRPVDYAFKEVTAQALASNLDTKTDGKSIYDWDDLNMLWRNPV